MPNEDKTPSTITGGFVGGKFVETETTNLPLSNEELARMYITVREVPSHRRHFFNRIIRYLARYFIQK